MLALTVAALLLPGIGASSDRSCGARCDATVDVDDRALARRGRRRGSATARASPAPGLRRPRARPAGARAFVGRARRRTSLGCAAATAASPTIVDLVPAAELGRARGPRPARPAASTATSRCAPLVAPSGGPARVDGPGSGDGVHEVAVGPIHAGVIESGHFRFHVVGERILRARPAAVLQAPRPRARGRGRARRRRRWPTRSAPARRARSPTPSPTRRRSRRRSDCGPTASCAARARCCSSSSASTTISTTSARICAGVGFAPGTMAFAALKERAQRINDRLAGHRFLFGTVAVGGGAFALDPRAADARPRGAARAARRRRGGVARARVRRLGPGAARRRRACSTRADALRLGAVGPGRARRRRAQRGPAPHSPRLAYDGLRARRAAAADR